MFQEAPGFEQRLTELQGQIDRLTISLQLWRDGQERLTPADERLARFADDVSDVLEEWSAIGDRHARAVEALEQQVAAFASVESRLHAESAERFITLQRMVQQEWATLRQLQLEPAGLRREQAAELTHACVTAATAVPFIPAEPSTDTEWDLQQHLAQVVVRAPAADAVPAAVMPEPREVVATAPVAGFVHVEAPAPTALVAEPAPAPVTPARPAVADEAEPMRAELTERLAEMHVLFRDTLERATDEQDALQRRNVRMVFVLALVLAALVAGGAWRMASLQREVAATSTRLADLEAGAARADAAAAQRLAEARSETARVTELARQAAADTEAMGAVLAAPDLARYALTGVEGSPMSAQLLWSRSRGLVLSATGVPAPPEGQRYQAWLLTESDAVSAGPLRIGADGRGTLIASRPPGLTGPVIGASITLETESGRTTPTGPIVALHRLARPTP